VLGPIPSSLLTIVPFYVTRLTQLVSTQYSAAKLRRFCSASNKPRRDLLALNNPGFFVPHITCQYWQWLGDDPWIGTCAYAPDIETYSQPMAVAARANFNGPVPSANLRICICYCTGTHFPFLYPLLKVSWQQPTVLRRAITLLTYHRR